MPFFIGLVARSDLWSKCIAFVCGENGKRRVRESCSNLSCIKWNCWTGWRLWMTLLLMLTFVVASVIWLTTNTYFFLTYDPFSPFKTWFVGIFFVLGTTAVTFISLRQHWVHYTRPYMQRYIIRIAFFVNAYSVYSWLALRYPRGSVYFDAFRQLQEAYALYCFFAYVVNYLNAEYSSTLTEALTSQPPLRLVYCCAKCKVPRYFVMLCRIGILQYCVIRVMLTTVTVIAQVAGVYGEGRVNIRRVSIYVQVINAVSQIVSMVFISIFYRGTKELTQPIKPFWKVVTIKLIVFITNFQGLVINVLGRFIIHDSETWEKLGFSLEPYTAPTTGIQNLLIIVEMFLGSVAVFFVFFYKPFVHDPQDGDAPFVSAWIKAFQKTETDSMLSSMDSTVIVSPPSNVHVTDSTSTGQCLDSTDDEFLPTMTTQYTGVNKLSRN